MQGTPGQVVGALQTGGVTVSSHVSGSVQGTPGQVVGLARQALLTEEQRYGPHLVQESKLPVPNRALNERLTIPVYGTVECI